jgi:DNA repair protein RadC
MEKCTNYQEQSGVARETKPLIRLNKQQESIQPSFMVIEDGQYEFTRPLSEDEIVELAASILDARFHRLEVLLNPTVTKNFLKMQLSLHEQEVFGCVYLDTRHRVICFEKLFYGTIDGASVHPREVVKNAMKNNAAAVILTHNHPSGVSEPSIADQRITQRLKEALSLVDVRVIDHIIVGGTTTSSFAEMGLL